jgi:lactoylglutathione lyase
MRTLHTAYRVTRLDVSLAFYTGLGYQVVGVVRFDHDGSLTMLKFPEEPVVTLELVYRPADGKVDIGSGFSHLVINVDDLSATLNSLRAAGLAPERAERPGGRNGPRTSWLTDPDGYRIELVEWPPGHPPGLCATDFL